MGLPGPPLSGEASGDAWVYLTASLIWSFPNSHPVVCSLPFAFAVLLVLMKSYET